MKAKIIFNVIFLIGGICFSQTGINYKALIKDGDGNILTNQGVGVQFIIYEGAALTNNVYQESHTTTTDANGLLITNIGEGTTADVFTNVNWSSDDHFLNVQVNTGSGLIDLGTTQFKTVPYAISAANVNGLEKITENGKTGHRIIGRNIENYGDIGVDAVDMSFNDGSSTTRGATGDNAVSMGFRTTASGNNATALGNNSVAAGNSSIAFGSSTFAPGNSATAMGVTTEALAIASTAMGRNTVASGDTATAMGSFTNASGSFSTSIGYGTEAPSHGETVIGTWNETYTPNEAVAFDENDRVFVVGNGTIVAPSNALTILKNGTITAPSFDVSEITDAKALVTKEYVDTTKGLEAIDEGNGIGWRLFGANPDNYGAIGNDAVDLSIQTATSETRGATGSNSFAVGPLSTASGFISTAMGEGTVASGSRSTAIGSNTEASGVYSTAMGVNTEASGNLSTAIGVYTVASSPSETVIGTFNTNYTPNSTTNWDSNDRLFVVGNGNFSTGDRSNALTILKNANTGIVTDTPQAKLHVTGGSDTGLGNNNGYLLLGETNGANISIDNNEIMAKNNGVASDLFLQIEGGDVLVGGAIRVNEVEENGVAMRVNDDEAIWYNGSYFSWGFGGSANYFADNVGIGTSNPQDKLHIEGGRLRIGTETIEDTGANVLAFDARLTPTTDASFSLGAPAIRWNTVYALNGSINTSDRREKKNIKDLEYGLAEILQMQPVSFNWKNKNNPDLKLGLIAQDLQELVPEVVNAHFWEKDETTNELIKKEAERLGVYYSDLVPVLIKAIQDQQEIIEGQKENLKSVEGNYKALLSRIEQLENNISN